MMEPTFMPLPDYQRINQTEMVERSKTFYEKMRKRRTVREFSEKPIPMEIIKNCLRTAGTAPSGANLQPWHFVIISDSRVKREIRLAAEEEEKAFYEEKAPQEWLDMLAPLGTDHHKPFLETAPVLIAIFVQSFGLNKNGHKVKHYYANESVGLAAGLLIAALHNAGLVSLTHTPSPMGFLNKILERPKNERPFLLLVTGYPNEDAQVPVISKKSLNQISTTF